MTKFLFQHIRVLPLVIFLSVLTLSIKINNLVENFSNEKSQFIGFNYSVAAENASPEADRLSQVLEKADHQASENTGLTSENSSSDNFTQSEIAILQELAERREALDLRSREIDKKAVQLKVAEQEIDKRLKQLQEYEQKLKKLIYEYNEKEREKLASLAKVYATMKAKDAARIFDTFDFEVTASLLKEMKPSASSAILAQMNAERAKAVTDKLIGNSL